MLVFMFGQILDVNVKGLVRFQMKGLPEFRIERNSWDITLAQGILLAFRRILRVNVKNFETSRLNCWTVLMFLYKSFKYWRSGLI